MQQTWRRGAAVGALLVGLLLVCCLPALALDPALDVSQYAHTAWKVRDGLFKAPIVCIAQTPDGYLWLGGEFGLLRFDGVRAVPWQPPVNQHLPSNSVTALLAARDETLWIGTPTGLASWKAGKLTNYPQLAGLVVNTLIEDHEGTVWMGGFAYTPPGKLCAIQNGNLHCYGDDGAFANGVLGLYEDTKGRLWAGGLNGFWQWKPGPPHFYKLAGEPLGIQSFAEDRDGTLLIPVGGRVVEFADGKIKDAYPYPKPADQSHGSRILRDRDGGVWIGTQSQGLVHLHQGSTDAFGQRNGLSGDPVDAILEDHEGSIWVATTKGLDRFRAYSVTTLSESQGVSSSVVDSVMAARDGSVWFSNRDRLSRWNKEQVTIYHEPGISAEPIGTAAQERVHRATVIGLPKHDFASLFQDRDRRIWIAASGSVGYVQNNRFVAIKGVPGGVVYAVAGDAKGNLWISNFDRGLSHLFRGNLVEQISWAALGRNDLATALAVDPSQGGVWLGFSKGGLAHLSDGHIRQSYTAADGLGEGRVSDVRFDQEGTLWAATDGGLSRVKDGRAATLTAKEGLPCDRILWAIEDDDHALWLYGSCGLIRISRSDLDAWTGTDSKDIPAHIVQATVFDSSDGVAIRGDLASAPGPQPSKSPDGKIWFPTLDGVSVIDQRHVPFNTLPPPVHIEQITADRKTYDATRAGSGDGTGRMRLTALIRDLQIDYTALSLVAPEKVQFKYKLEGFDNDWQDAGNRRQAFYTNLPPKNYTFRVKACNNSGVWNEEAAFLDFSIAPAYYQTNWFRALCVAAFLALLWALYQYRLHQIQRQFNISFESRVDERTRIARELHDTLLQSLHGLLFRFQAARNLFPRRPGEAMEVLDGAIARTEQAIAESQNAITDLRPAPVDCNDLGGLLMATGKELEASGNANGAATTFALTLEGERQTLSPILQDEVYRIGRELLRNAFRHACAHRVETEVRYDVEQLRVRIRDDGKGMDPDVLKQGRRQGHWGLPGVKERAQRIGAQLDFWSEAGAGTEVQLSVPATLAYMNSHGRARFRFFRRKRS